jgi:hypothetical protein
MSLLATYGIPSSPSPLPQSPCSRSVVRITYSAYALSPSPSVSAPTLCPGGRLRPVIAVPHQCPSRRCVRGPATCVAVVSMFIKAPIAPIGCVQDDNCRVRGDVYRVRDDNHQRCSHHLRSPFMAGWSTVGTLPHKRPFVGSIQGRSWSHWVVLGAVCQLLDEMCPKNLGKLTFE